MIEDPTDATIRITEDGNLSFVLTEGVHFFRVGREVHLLSLDLPGVRLSWTAE